MPLCQCGNWLKRIYTNLSAWQSQSQRSKAAATNRRAQAEAERKCQVCEAQTHTHTDKHLSTCTHIHTYGTQRHPHIEIERITEMNHFIRVGNAYDMSTRHENFTRLWECGRGTGPEKRVATGWRCRWLPS